MRTTFAILAALTFASTTAAQNSRPIPAMPTYPACDLGEPARLVERMTDLPPEARLELARLTAPIGGMAEAGTYFQSSDAISGDAPRTRFIRAYGMGNGWIIWFERGGFMLTRSIIALAPERDQSSGSVVLRSIPNSNLSGNLCAASRAFLAGVRTER